MFAPACPRRPSLVTPTGPPCPRPALPPCPDIVGYRQPLQSEVEHIFKAGSYQDKLSEASWG